MEIPSWGPRIRWILSPGKQAKVCRQAVKRVWRNNPTTRSSSHPQTQYPPPSMIPFSIFVSSFALLSSIATEAFLVPPPTSFAHGNLRKSALYHNKRAGGGGRASGQGDVVLSSDDWEPRLCHPSEARLTIIQITDTYTLENLASVKTLIADVKSKSKGAKVISMMTGDFLSPYLLSSVDRGQGMMNALAKIPIDYLTWGNHEVRKVKGEACPCHQTHQAPLLTKMTLSNPTTSISLATRPTSITKPCADTSEIFPVHG